MQTSVTFKNLDPSDTLKTYVADKLDRFDRFLDNPAEANVVLQVEKFRHIAEIKISGDRLTINGKEETNDMYSAIDMVLDKLEIQIKRSKDKTRKHRGQDKSKAKELLRDMASTPLPHEHHPRVQVMNIEYKPMDIDEAVLQLGLTTDNFLVFTNAKTDRVNVIYKRNDGDYGLVQPAVMGHR